MKVNSVLIREASINGTVYPLTGEESFGNENWYTIIIGKNATGKSRFLVNISNILRSKFSKNLISQNLKNYIKCLLLIN